MPKAISHRKLRIPIQCIGGVWEFKLGGPVPLKERSEAELIVNRRNISDPTFLESLELKGKHKLFDEATKLIVSLKVKSGFQPSAELCKALLPYHELEPKLRMSLSDAEYGTVNTFAEIRISAPSEKQKRTFSSNKGGLRLLTCGVEAIGLASTNIILPQGVEPNTVGSLNHAYTRLSEIFESWRTSHTGNIYQRILYQERNGNWYPLEFLRNRALQRADHEVAQGHWKTFLASMSKFPPV